MADNNDQGDVPSWATGLADFSAAPPAAAPDDTSFKPSNYLVKPDVAPVVPEKEEDPLSKMLSEAEQTNSLPPKQFNPDGSAIPGTSAAFKGETAHPLSIAVMKSYDLVDEVDRDRYKISEAIATALGVEYQEDLESGKTIKTYLNMTPQAVDQLDDATRERLKARPDVKRLMNQESMTRTMLAEDNEKVAILAGYIPLVSAAEGALKTALRFNADVKGTSPSAFDRSFGITELSEKGDFGAGTASINAVKRMENRYLNAFTGTLALARAMNVIEFESDLVAATTIAPIPQTPEDLKMAQELFSENVNIMKKGSRILNHPDVRKLMKELSVLDSENIQDPAVWAKAMGIVANNPVGWQMLAVEQTIENAPLLVVSAAMTALGGPALGITASTAGESWQEAFLMTPERIAMVKEKFGHDMYTVKGVEAFVKDQAALAAYAEWGVKRAVPIAVMNVVGLGALAKIHKVLKMSKTAQLAAGTVTEMITQGLGEAGAMKLTEGKVKISEVLLESLGAGNPGSTAIRMYTAVGSDASEKLSKVRAERWLKAGGEMAQSLNGIPESKISTAAEILSERMRADGVDTVYIQADELLRFDQDESVINTLGLTSEAVRTAARDGNDVAIDTATYIRHILGKTGFEALIRHTRFEDTIMTGAEAEQYVSATDGVSIKDQLTKEAMSRIAPGVDEKTLADMSTSGGLIREQVAQQLEATGKYTAGQSALYGQLTEQRYITRSVRMLEKTGKYVSPMDLIIKDNLRIQGSDTRTNQNAAPAFGQRTGTFSDYLNVVDPQSRSIPAEDRPNLRMGDMYGMLPKKSEVVGEMDGVTLHRGPNGDYYATAFNPDVGEDDVVGYIQGRDNGTELAVVEEMQGKGIGGELQYLFRRENPYAPTGGLTDAGKRRLETTYDRLMADEILSFEQTAKEFNVTPEQLKAELEAAGGDITQTPAFKAWFGDSKVVDADGKPLVVYHGTAADFEAFDLVFSKDGVQGKGFYFTTRKPLAEDYAYGANRDQEGRLIEAYVSLKNPVIKRPGVPLSSEEIAAIRSDFAEGGYDGFIEYLPSGGINTVIATGSTQIKSVNNRGTFDPNDNRILYQDIAQAEAELGKAFSEERIPALEEAARQRSEGEITQAQYDAIVTELKPIRPYTTVPTPATEAQMRSALKAGQQERVGKGNQFVGDNVGLRLDIPAYTNHGTWVPTMHDQKGKPIAHEAAAKITGVSFTQPGDAAERKAARVGTGETSKSPFAQINGTLQSVDPASLQAEMEAALNDPAWTQVGYDPRRHTFFYDRSTQQPILSADEVIQVGPLVMAKNAVSGDGAAFLFQDQDGVGNSLKSAQTLLRDNPEALGLTPDLVGYVNQIYRPDVIPAKKMAGNKAVAAWLEKAFPGVSITDMTATLPPETIERIATIMAAEAQLGLENTGSAFDWYSGALNRALDVVQIKYPMVADDKAAADAGFGTAENARFVFTYIMAVTSQNLDVKANSVATDKIFAQMLDKVKSGDFTMDKSWGTGDKRKAMGENFAKFGPLIQAMEGDTFPEKIANLNNLFRDSRSVTEWVKDMKAAGIPYSKPGQTAMSSIVYGSSLLGPKIGNGFWQNLNGNFNPLTIDLWMRRTWGRLTGKSIGNPEALPTQRKRFKAAIERSRSNEHGAPDLIADMKQMLENIDEQIAIITDPERFSWTGSKKAQTAYLKSLKAERKLLSEALPDMEGIKAPEPWNASYAKDDAALLAYAKRVLKVWDVEYKRLREENDAVPAELQPTWARAAKTIITNLAKPLDQVNNGTQRTQIEAAGRRALEILKERGIELTTADLQALLWYPEKELWGALGTKLEVDEDGTPIVPPSSLNESYDTTFSRILREQGYAVEGIAGDEVAGSGAGTVAGGDARSQRPEGVAGAGQAGSAGRGTAALSQGEAGAPRGSFAPSDLINDQDGNPVNLIQIFEGADPSTFLHESGHFWLEMLKADAQSVGGQFQKDWSIVNDWWGLRSLEIKDEAIRRAKKKKDKAALAVLEKMTDAQVKAYIRKGDLRGSSDPAARFLSVSMHEQFARGTETYFATGKAPSIALTSIFNSFKVWLLSVYNRMRGTDVKFSEDVSAIMDRMLATDEEIAAMAGQYQLASIFDSAETMGVSKEEFAAHQKKVADAKSRSAAEQLAKHLRDLRMEKTDWWNEEREGMREDVTKRFAEKPAYRVMAAIFHGGRYDGSTIPDSEKLPRMNREALEEALDDEGMTLATMPKDGSKVIYMPGKEGSDPAIVAATFGYEDVSAMLKDLSARPDFEGAVNAELDRMMHDKHSVMTTALETESLASIHGDHHAGVMAAELHALRTVEPAFKPAFIKQYAMDQIMEMPLKDIKPHLFVLAEKRHAGFAKKALAKGDRAEAYRHQFQRLINHRKAEAALKVQKDVEKKTKALRKLQKATKMPSVDAKYAAKIKDILNAVDFSRPLSERTKLKEELKAINDFIAQSLEDDGAILRVPEIISRAEGLKNTDDMTYSEYLEMSGFVFTLERQGKLAKKLRVGKENRDREEVKLELLSKLDKIGDTFVSMLSADAMGPRMAAKGAAVSGLSFVMSLDSSLLKTESLMESIDGEPLGPWHQTIYQPIADAYWEKARLTKEVTARVTKLIKALPKEVQKSMNKTVDVGGLGFPGGKMKRSALIMMALNMGTESNMDKLIRGYGGDKKTKVRGLGWNINEDLINGALDNLTKEEWDLVQAIWTEAEALWPEVANIMAEENGLPPERLEHRTVKTKFGDIAGGYFPMIYDYDVVYDSSLNNIEKKKILEAMKGNAGLGGVDIGSTKSRTSFAAPVSLDFSNLTRGLEDTIHIITHYEAGRNVRKILNDGDIQIQLKTKVGPEYANDLELWLSAAISNGAGTPPLNAWQKGGQFLINNTTMSFLGFSYSTLGMQTIGLTSSLDRLMADKTYGPITAAEMTARLSHGLTMAVVPENYRFVTQSSPFMASRIEEYNDEARRIIKESQKTFSVNSPFIWGMKAIAVAQYLTVDVPTWTAAYNIATTNEDKNDPRIHAKAVKYADRVVRLSQSSGGKVDLSRWQREATGMNKMFNMFYTWFSALYAVEREMGREFGQNMPKKPVGAIGRLMSRMLILFVVSSVGAGLVRGELPDWEPEDEDEQGLAAYLAVQSASTALGSIPYVRETSGILTGFGFKLAGATFLEQFSKVANEIVKNIADDEEAVDWDDKSAQELAKKAKPWILLGGSLTGAPSTLINRFLSGYSAYKDDAPNWEPIDLIRGYNKDRAAKR
jgi:hypothetical protein